MKHIAWLVLSLVLLTGAVALASDEEVLITFPHSVPDIQRHGNLLVVVHYRKDDRNRKLEVEWDSKDGDAGRSVVEIDAKNNGIPVSRDLNLSAAEYVFVVTLYRSDGSKATTIKSRLATR